MPTQDVFRSPAPFDLLNAWGNSRAILLDGSGEDSWGDGHSLFAAAPLATIEAFPSGWSRWTVGESVHWRRGDPLVEWRRFMTIIPSRVGVHDASAAGFLTVLGYDLKHWIERLERRHDWSAEPVLYCAFYGWLYSVDHRSGTARVGAQTRQELDALLRSFEHLPTNTEPFHGDPPLMKPQLGREQYVELVEEALRYIAAGDMYQVNLAQCFESEDARIDPALLFSVLQQRAPMPFAAYVDGISWKIVSGSPECFLTTNGRDVITFPIKGTRRYSDLDSCAEPSGGLAADPKEQAEHVMIVDLERNDLGRVCDPGSIEVEELRVVRSYPLLQHMVSKVRGRLREGTELVELIRALFPGGSITGAPKIRAMQIIEELEPRSRGFYTGAIGWTDLNGASRFNLMIRTAVQTGSNLRYYAGGGIVADSDPEREYDECLLKSQAFFDALAALRLDASFADEPLVEMVGSAR